MRYTTYVLREDTIHDEEGEPFTVYGINAVDSCGNIIRAVSDIFFDRKKAEKFILLCNREKLELVHLWDVIDDQME